MYVCMYTHVHSYTQENWLIIVEVNLKAPFSIATTPNCTRGINFFPWIDPLTLDLYLITLRHQVPFLFVFDVTQPRIEPRHPEPYA